MNEPLIALSLQPDEPEQVPQTPVGDSQMWIFVAFALVIGAVFAFDLIRTWWETNRWRRDARRRRREMF